MTDEVARGFGGWIGKRSGLFSARYRRLFNGIFSTAATKTLSLLISLVSLPLAVRYLGAERYGIWATITTTVAWISIMDLGIASTLTNSVSRAYALEDKKMAAHYVANALAATCAVVGLIVPVSVYSWLRLDWVRLFNVGPQVSAHEVSTTVGLAMALVLISLPSSLGARILSGYQETHLLNYSTSIGALAGLAGLAIGISQHLSMPVLFLISTGCMPAMSALTFLWIVAFHKPWLMPRLSYLNFGTAKELLQTGSSFFMLQIAGIIVFSSDNLVVGHYLGASRVTPYAVTWRLIGYSSVLQTFMFPALWPAYAEADARRDYAWMRQTFSAAMKTTLISNVVLLLLLVAFGRRIIALWAGPAAVPALSLLAAMAVWSLISAFMNVEACLLGALNRVRAQGILSIIAALLNLALSIALVQRIGSLGVILATIASYLIVLVGPQTYIVRQYFRSIPYGSSAPNPVPAATAALK